MDAAQQLFGQVNVARFIFILHTIKHLQDTCCSGGRICICSSSFDYKASSRQLCFFFPFAQSLDVDVAPVRFYVLLTVHPLSGLHTNTPNH